jgi:tRNA-dihydrouridine synthase B
MEYSSDIMEYRIGNVKIKNRFFLAPMASVTDMAFRILCKKYGAGLVYTEMISSEAIVRGKHTQKMRFSKYEKPVALQIFGSNPEVMIKAAKIIEKTGADIIDINMGCPEDLIIKQGAGAALLKTPRKAQEIIEGIVKTVEIPVTVKTRIGFNKLDEGLKIAKIVEKSGASAISIHGRTVKQGYSGKADWDAIKKIKNTVNIPVIGSGDIFSARDAERMIEQTNCDFVMIGRGAMGNPFIFKELNDYFAGKKIVKANSKEKIHAFLDYIKIAQKNKIIDFNSAKIHLNYFIKGMKNASKLRLKISRIKNLDDMMKEIELLKKSFRPY